jgi:arylsulfatase A-like enzyme/Tfp pilus assembly protein PilF
MSASDSVGKSRWVTVFVLLVLTGVVATWFFFRPDASPLGIRNVLLISIDTCRGDYLSCYGYRSRTTPNIDALAAEGILFENAITPIPQTLPGHSSMLTGTIPPYHGVHDNLGYLLHESDITLAEILKDAGFTTGAIVSTIVLDSQSGIDQGFDTYDDHFESPMEGNPIKQRQGGETTRLAVDWLDQHKEKHFFLFLHYFDPHAIYEPPEPFASRFASSPYAGEIAYTDHCVGQVLAKLKELGLYDSTLIIITSDHGEMLGEHGEGTHAYFIYESVIRVPLIFRLPGQNKPARIESISGLIDIVPTVCSLLNIEIPEQVEGVDLSASFNGQAFPVQDRQMFCESFYPVKYKANSLLGILNDRFKYIQTTRPELYDLIQDPREAKNLVEEQPQRARMMKDQLAQILKQSVRESQRRTQVDAQTIKQLESLGYVGGTVAEDLSFDFDQTKDDPKDLLEYHLLAMKIPGYLTLKKYDKAEIVAEQMIYQRPELSDGYETMGLTALGAEDYHRAVIHLEKAIEIGPEMNRVANVYTNRGLAYAGGGLYERAFRDFDKAIEIDPGYAPAYFSRGLGYLTQRSYGPAIRDLDKAIELNPGLAEAYCSRGAAYGGRGQEEQAIQDFNKAIELNPNFAAAYSSRGAAYGSRGRNERAIRDFNNAIKLNPALAEAYKNRGLAYTRQGDHDRAIRDFDQLIELRPDDFKAYLDRGQIYEKKNNYEQAIRDYNRTMELNPKDGMAYNNLAWIRATNGDVQFRDGNEAVSLAERACQLTHYENPAMLDTLAAAYAEVGQLDEAAETAEKAVHLALGAGQQQLADDIQSRMNLYRGKQPYRDSL